MKQAIYKVPDGKLLKIFLEEENGKIKNVKITGDFFMHPEEKITVLEEALRGADLNEQELQQKLKNCLETESIELFGADAGSMAKTVILAASS